MNPQVELYNASDKALKYDPAHPLVVAEVWQQVGRWTL